MTDDEAIMTSPRESVSARTLVGAAAIKKGTTEEDRIVVVVVEESYSCCFQIPCLLCNTDYKESPRVFEEAREG